MRKKRFKPPTLTKNITIYAGGRLSHVLNKKLLVYKDKLAM